MIDTNVFVSFLLHNRARRSSIGRLLDALSEDQFIHVLSEDVTGELVRVIASKPFLKNSVPLEVLTGFVEFLRKRSEIVPTLTGTAPSIVRDPGDDFLIAAAMVANVDVLVTGDHDLLALRDFLPKPRIMTPAEFVELLDKPS